MNRKGIRVWVDVPDPEPRRNKDMNVWKCYSCQYRYSSAEPDLHCPNCKRMTQWLQVSVLPAESEEGQDMQDMQDIRSAQELSKIKTMLGIKGSSRPCRVSTCAGKMYAYMHHYKDGSFRLVFTCERCHRDYVPGTGTAVTNAEPVGETAEPVPC